jgi:hypothetical protein
MEGQEKKKRRQQLEYESRKKEMFLGAHFVFCAPPK